MDAENATVGVALLAVGALVLLGSAAGLFTGNLNVIEYAAPVALVGLALALAGVWRLERDLEGLS